MQSGQYFITQHELGFNLVETMVESLLMSQALLAAAIGVLYEYLRVVWAPGSKNIICIFEMSCFQSFL